MLKAPNIRYEQIVVQIIENPAVQRIAEALPVRSAHHNITRLQMNRANYAVVRLVSALAAQLERTSEIMLLLGGAVEDGTFSNHHDADHERPSPTILPDISDNQSV